MGINQKRSRTKKQDKATLEKRRFDRELRECMHCKYFWGNNHQCLLNKCSKSQNVYKKEKSIPEKCKGCSYNQSDNYCFPCMKDMLSK